MHAETFARGLYALARCDGLHKRESAIIASFWAETGLGRGALAVLERQPDITAEQLAGQLKDVGERRYFIKTAILLAWSDGEASEKEMHFIDALARALEISDGDLMAIAEEVQDDLLSHRTRL
jgi:uncharacterized membrane protein YebE (DUF533 family)